MKTALCLSGQPRFAKENFDNLKRNILEPTNPDVFCFFWDTEIPEVCAHPKQALALYSPVDYRIVPQRKFDDSILDIYGLRSELNEWMYQRINSMFYANWRCNKLCSEYGGEYDCVIKCRTDLVLEGSVNPIEFAEAPDDLWCYMKSPRPWNFSYGDEIAWGPSAIMDVWSSVWLHIPKAIEDLRVVRPERFLTYTLEQVSSIGDTAQVSKIGGNTIMRNEQQHTQRLQSLGKGKAPVNDD